MENEVIFGSEQRLREVLDGLSGKGEKIAVVMTCVPAILGEDVQIDIQRLRCNSR